MVSLSYLLDIQVEVQSKQLFEMGYRWNIGIYQDVDYFKP